MENFDLIYDEGKITQSILNVEHLLQGKVPCLGPYFVFEFFQTTSHRNLKK